MKMHAPDPSQTSQRIKVGMIGLAGVMLMIGLAAAVFSTASRETSVAGGADAAMVANIAAANSQLPSAEGSEPLADLGLTPSTSASTSPGAGRTAAPAGTPATANGTPATASGTPPAAAR